MKPIYVYKLLPSKNQLVAKITRGEKGLLLNTGEVHVLRVLQAALSKPALVSEKEGGATVKRAPDGLQEMVESRLKRSIPRPYFLSSDSSPIPEEFEEVEYPLPKEVIKS